MAFLLNPQFGQSPGAPRGLNWWDQNRFMMSDLQGPQAPAAPQAPPAPAPLAPQVNAQDMAAQQAVQQFASGGGEGSGGNPSAANFTGIGTNPDGSPSRAGNTGLGNGGGPVAPNNYSSNYGGILGTLGSVGGMAAGVPGLGMLGGLAGNAMDLNNYAGVLGRAGIPFSPNYGQALLSSIGIPFTDINFGRNPRQQSEDARRDFLGNWGPTAGNVESRFAPAPMSDFWGLGFNAPADASRTAAQANAQTDATLGSIASTGYTNDASYQAGSRGLDPGIAAQAAYDANAGMGQTTPDTGNSWGPGNDGFGIFAKGGRVRGPGLLPGVDPPGPDNIVGGLQTGEGVITKAAMQRYGPGLLNAINSGKINPARLRGLLSR